MTTTTLAGTTPVEPGADAHPVVVVARFLLGTNAGLVCTLILAVAVTCIFSKTARLIVGPFWRFATGGLVFTEMSPWHSTWLRPAPDRPAARPNFRGESYPLTSWGRRPGWQRMLIRWAVIGYGAALVAWPIVTIAATVLVGGTIVLRQLVRNVNEWAHKRTVGTFAAGAAKVLQRGDDPLTWIAIPRVRLSWVPIVVTPTVVEWFTAWPSMQHRLTAVFRRMTWLDKLAVPTLRVPLEDDDARVLVQLDVRVTDKPIVTEVARLGVARLPDGPWDHEHHERDLTLEFRHPKRPPAHVAYTADAFNAYPIDEVPIGQRAGEEWVTLPLKKLTPHGVMSATTGWCKTSTANVYVAHTAGNGGLVFINDPKRVGYTHFAGLPNVIIRTTADGWADTVTVFLGEMERRYELILRFPEIKEDPELYFQPWFLLNDERGSYVSDIRDRAKQNGEKGTPVTLRHEKKILWQARAAGMYVADFAQQANLSVFLDSDGRDQRMWRIASGPQSRSSWFMLFPGIAKMRVAMKKGRALLGIGVDDVTEIQLAQLSDDEARAFVEAGIGIADREDARRRERLAALIASESDTSVPAASPGETTPDVRPSVPDTRTPEDDPEFDSTSPVGMLPGQREGGMSADTAGADSANVLDLREAPDTAETIVGLEAGADYLGMTQTAFEKARQRRPIRGEFRTGVQPSWKPLDLREWRNQAPRAGGVQ